MKTSIALYAFLLATICVTGAVVLAALGKDIPADLWNIALVAVGGGAGVAIPSAGAGSTTTVTTGTTPTVPGA